MKDKSFEIKSLAGKNFELEPPIKKEKAEQYEKLLSLLEKHDVGEMVADILNLKWQEKVIVEDMSGGYGADYQVPNKAFVDYSGGVWAASGIAHEMVHLILYQNKWTDTPEIKEYIERHPDLQNFTRMRTVGYPIEQMVAYLLMRDVMLEISDKDKSVSKEQALSQYGESWFNRILDKEYPTKHLKALGRKIISQWQTKPSDISVINWVETLLV